jgi:superfamily II DNA/RNA helicase
MSFSNLGLSASLVNHLLSVGFKTPTPVQFMVIPKYLRNSDIMASAQTGTGKTGAFLLPAIDYLLHARKREKLPRILILEPTRELATQVYEEFQRFNKGNALNAVVLVGGGIKHFTRTCARKRCRSHYCNTRTADGPS